MHDCVCVCVIAQEYWSSLVPPSTVPDSAKAPLRLVTLANGVWSAHELAALGPVDVVFLDLTAIVGNDLQADGVALARMVCGLFPTMSTLVVKSRQLSTLAYSYTTHRAYIDRVTGSERDRAVAELASLDAKAVADHAIDVAAATKKPAEVGEYLRAWVRVCVLYMCAVWRVRGVPCCMPCVLCALCCVCEYREYAGACLLVIFWTCLFCVSV